MTERERTKPVLFTVNSAGNKSHKPEKKKLGPSGTIRLNHVLLCHHFATSSGSSGADTVTFELTHISNVEVRTSTLPDDWTFIPI